MDPREARIQRHIYKRVVQALDGRSWNWLAETSGVPQSTLATQSSKPRFSLEVLILISSALKKPPVWFMPHTPDCEQKSEAFDRIADIVKSSN